MMNEWVDIRRTDDIIRKQAEKHNLDRGWRCTKAFYLLTKKSIF